MDEEINDWILERCKPLAPELLDRDGHFEVLSLQVGHRPTREGGPRLEIELINATSDKQRFICHHYGHGSSGYVGV